MLRTFLMSFGLSAVFVTACDPEALIASRDASDYEVVTQIAD
jgi:hypothetical protein